MYNMYVSTFIRIYIIHVSLYLRISYMYAYMCGFVINYSGKANQKVCFHSLLIL